jgi:hypothetical protein
MVRKVEQMDDSSIESNKGKPKKAFSRDKYKDLSLDDFAEMVTDSTLCHLLAHFVNSFTGRRPDGSAVDVLFVFPHNELLI